MSAPGSTPPGGQKADPGDPPPLDPALHGVAIWQTIASRRATYDTMMWQTPALGLAAQAFLFTLALAPDTFPTGRLIAASLSLTLSVLVLQLMAKHRHLESRDTLLLESLERSLGFSEALGSLPHGRMIDRYPPALMQFAPPEGRVASLAARAVGLKSFRVWMVGQSLFGLAAIAVIVMVVIGRTSWIGAGA